MTDLTALMLAIDECGDRLAAETSMLDAAKARVHDLDIEHAALMRALALAQSPQPASVQETKPKVNDKLALAACIAAIRNHFADSVANQMTDRAAATALKAHGYKFRLPTVRNALAMIGVESRAAETEQDDSHVNRSCAREASLSLAPNSGAVTCIEAE